MSINTDVYYHKTVNFRFWKQSLRFRTSQQLFSAHNIDTGSRFLLRTIAEADYPQFQRILDAGCGYGPLGLTLKSLYCDSVTHLFDRDALAVAYARQNAGLNGLTGLEIYGSLGYDDVKRNDFDLIVSNIPDHAGEKVIAYLIREARHYLAPGGIIAIVVVAPLEELVAKVLADTPGAAIILKRNRSGHAVFHYQFSDVKSPAKPAHSALERGIYHRDNVTMRPGKLEYIMQTANGLSEFDSLSYGGEMLVEALENVRGGEVDSAVVFNPGQGHTAVALWKSLQPGTITLVDRDLLALRYSQLNLKLNGCPPERVSVSHQVGLETNPQDKSDLIIGALREEEGKNASFLLLDRATGRLSDQGIIMMASGSTAVTRLADYAASGGLLRIKARGRRRGYSLLVLERA